MTSHPIDLRRLYTNDPPRFFRLFDGFVKLYESAFPAPADREDPQSWIARLIDQAQPWMGAAVVTVCDDSNPLFGERVIAAIAFEYHIKSNCGLISYLAVDPVMQGRGLAKALVKYALENLRDAAQGKGQILAAVFTEAENPDRIAACAYAQGRPADELVTMARRRLGIWSRLGAVVIEINYVAPALAAFAQKSHYYLLMLVRQPDDESDFVQQESLLKRFLYEFYKLSDGNDPYEDEDFITMESEINRCKNGLFKVQDRPDRASVEVQNNRSGRSLHI